MISQLTVVHVITALETGGAQNALKQLVLAPSGRPDVRHHVLALSDGGTLAEQIAGGGVPVDSLGARGMLDLPGTYRRLRRRIDEIEPDIVHCWLYHADLIGGLAARAAGLPVIWGVRSTDIPPGKGTARKTSLIRRACALLSARLPDRIAYVANSARASHERIGYAADRGIVIPNGFDLPELPENRAERRALRERLGLPTDALLIGSVGRFNYLKDHRGFITAAASLAATHPALRFVLVGTNLDADNAQLGRWIAAAGIADRVHLMGERSDVSAILPAFDLFCLHSLTEAFPNVLAEAMAAGLPCVSTDVGDAAMLLDGTGWLAPPGAPDALAGALATAVAEGAEARAERGARGRARIAGAFSRATMVDRFERLYFELSRTPPSYAGKDETTMKAPRRAMPQQRG